jgi:hypothetical protein
VGRNARWALTNDAALRGVHGCVRAIHRSFSFYVVLVRLQSTPVFLSTSKAFAYLHFSIDTTLGYMVENWGENGHLP